MPKLPERQPLRRTPAPLNGIHTPGLFATIDVVKNQPQLAAFQFRAKGKWLRGTHMQTTMADFSGAGGEHSHKAAYTAEADHPAVLCGQDNGPTPVEYVLHALAACITAGIANIAAARGVALHSVTSSLEGDMDLRGILGLSKEVQTASALCASHSTSRETHPRRSCGRSSSRHAPAPPFSTS